VAIGAQQTEIFQSVVVVVPIDVVEFQGNRLTEPARVSAERASVGQHVLLQQPVLELVGLNRRLVVEISSDRDFGWQAFPFVPGATAEVRCIDDEMAQCLFQYIVIAAIGSYTECMEDLSHRS
jgi:hypothetical protein